MPYVDDLYIASYTYLSFPMKDYWGIYMKKMMKDITTVIADLSTKWVGSYYY